MESPSFAAALDSAITDAGLSLDGVRRRLTARGVPVSRTILSYWRHGRSQPERATSLVAVAELERVLNLPARSLTDLLGPHAPRGRWLAGPRGVLPRTRLWPGSAPLFADLHAPPDGQLEFWSIHDQVLVDAGGRERMLRVRLVARAAMDGVHRMMIYHHAPALEREQPRVAAVRFGGRPPERIRQYGQRAYQGPRHYLGASSVGSTNAVTLALTDVQPGIAGADWQW